MPSPFSRTTCACAECVACCKRQPGPLAPGDLERIAEHRGETVEVAKAHFWASGGALVQDQTTGRQFRIGSITPRLVRGRCVFLDADDRCSIHSVAPFGCAYFDTHMTAAEGQRRGAWLARRQLDDDYQELRRQLPFATSYKPKGY
jgi:Fe-S-cluster containining protein